MGPGPESLEEKISSLRYLGGIFLEEMAQLYTVHLKGLGFADAVNTRLLRKLRFSDLPVWGEKTKPNQT